MSLTVIATFEAKRGDEDRLRTALEGMIEPSLDEPGCLAYQPYADQNDASMMVIVEEWTGRDALDLHFTTPHFLHVADVLDRVLAQPFTIRYLVDA